MESKKAAPKFKIKIVNDHPPVDPRIDELKKWCVEFSKNGLMPDYGSGCLGNLSFRLKTGNNSFIITASGMKADWAENSFVEVSSIDLAKKTVFASGKRLPSSESMLHYLIYQKRPDINAIFHGHCDKITDGHKQLNLSCTTKEEPYGTVELADRVLEILGENNFVVMKNHGFISCGMNMKEAGESALCLAAHDSPLTFHDEANKG